VSVHAWASVQVESPSWRVEAAGVEFCAETRESCMVCMLSMIRQQHRTADGPVLVPTVHAWVNRHIRM
jgi:hypothetical protein